MNAVSIFSDFEKLADMISQILFKVRDKLVDSNFQTFISPVFSNKPFEDIFTMNNHQPVVQFIKSSTKK